MLSPQCSVYLILMHLSEARRPRARRSGAGIAHSYFKPLQHRPGPSGPAPTGQAAAPPAALLRVLEIGLAIPAAPRRWRRGGLQMHQNKVYRALAYSICSQLALA